MMVQKSILIVFGTRPEIIKLAPLIQSINNSHLKNKLLVASTSQHEDLIDEQLEYWNIKPDYYLTTTPNQRNLTRLLSHTITGLQDILDQYKTIKYIIVQGDTNTALACSLFAFLNQVKLIHIEAGLRTYDKYNPFPEEFNRTIASKIAHHHFAPTELSRSNLLNEGIDLTRISVVGNTIIDALNIAKANGLNSVLNNKSTIIITLHRRENITRNYLILIDIVFHLAMKYPHLKFIWITHPNCAKSIQSKIQASENIEILEHMGYKEFVALYDNAKMVITDSGGVSEEAIHLGIPIIIFRKTTERIEPVSEQYPMLVSLKKLEIMSFFDNNVHSTNTIRYSYGEGNASEKILGWLINEVNRVDFDLLVIGGGPAGTGLLLKAIKDEDTHGIFGKKIALIEKSGTLIKGNLTEYIVNSDTLSDVFLECIEGAAGATIDLVELFDEIEVIKSYKGKSIPLKKLNSFYDKLGQLLKDALEKQEKCKFIMNACVSKVIQKENFTYEVIIEGQKQSITARKIIIATGGSHKMLNFESNRFADKISLRDFEYKCIYSDSILKYGLQENLKNELNKKQKVVVLGGSHSAFSVAHYLLNFNSSIGFTEGDIKIWSCRLPKVYFNNKEDAISAGYSDFTDNDFCPISGKLYRLAGLRMDGRDLYMQMHGIGNLNKENRVTFNLFTNQNVEILDDLNNATLIVLALGYKLNIIPFFTEMGERIEFKGERTDHWVNDNCEILKENGIPVPGVFATGLATGFIPNGELGGEPGFEGQTNGIWYYQNAIADRIMKNLNREHSSSMQ